MQPYSYPVKGQIRSIIESIMIVTLQLKRLSDLETNLIYQLHIYITSHLVCDIAHYFDSTLDQRTTATFYTTLNYLQDLYPRVLKKALDPI